nr:hypothetical protein BSM_14270 [uncultured archaeon]
MDNNFIKTENNFSSFKQYRIKEVKSMAEPIRLGLVLKGDDAREFEERMKNPKVSKEQVKFFREAIKVYNMHKF